MVRLTFSSRVATGPKRHRRLRNSRARRRRRSLAGLALLFLGLGVVGFALVAASTPQPAPVRLDPDGSTPVPQTHFYQNSWVLYALVADPRRVPEAADLGCRPTGSLRLEPQPADMTRYGARVVEGSSISAALLLSRSGADAAVECRNGDEVAPLVLAASSEAPAFTATAIGIGGVLLLVLGALVHPVTVELPSRLRAPRPGDDLLSGA